MVEHKAEHSEQRPREGPAPLRNIIHPPQGMSVLRPTGRDHFVLLPIPQMQLQNSSGGALVPQAIVQELLYLRQENEALREENQAWKDWFCTRPHGQEE